MTTDELMELATTYGHNLDSRHYQECYHELRLAIEQALAEAREAGQKDGIIKGAMYVLDHKPVPDAQPVAWLLRPIVQRHPSRPLVRGVYTEPRTAHDYEIAALDGDEYVPLYLHPAPDAQPVAPEHLHEWFTMPHFLQGQVRCMTCGVFAQQIEPSPEQPADLR